MKRKMTMAICAVALALIPLSSVWAVWEGNAGIATAGEFPGSGLFARSDMFPKNTVVEIRNLENEKTVKAVITGPSGIAGLVAMLSPETAAALNMRSGSVARVRISVPAVAERPAAGTYVEPTNTESADPDANPAIAAADSVAAETAAAETAAAETAAVTDAADTEAAAAETVAATDLVAADATPAVDEVAMEPAEVAAVDEVATEPAEVAAADESIPAGETAVTDESVVADEPELVLADEAVPAPEAELVTPMDAAAVAAEAAPVADEAAVVVDEAAIIAAASGAAVTDAAEPLLEESAELAESGEPALSGPFPTDTVITLVPADALPPEAPTVEPTAIPLVDAIAQGSEPVVAEVAPAAAAPIAPVTAAPASPAPAAVPVATIAAGDIPLIAALSKGAYYVQIGTYSDARNVRSILDNYGKKYPVSVEKTMTKNGECLKVYIGPVLKDEYGAVLEKFKSIGFKDAFVRKGQ